VRSRTERNRIQNVHESTACSSDRFESVSSNERGSHLQRVLKKMRTRIAFIMFALFLFNFMLHYVYLTTFAVKVKDKVVPLLN
jgi:hypothetical protein